MKKFIVERNLPGAANLSPGELQAFSQSACDAIDKFERPYYWIQSFITGDKIYCIHIAENEDVVKEHARLSKLPINTIAEVKAVIDPMTGNI
ncbi:MAG TPA: DUF4242 domain-containing protein [Chitinophagaceae bacterium]